MANKKDDVSPQPDFFVDLRCYPNEDLKVLREKYKFVESSPSADDVYFKNLGFNRQIDTLACTRDRKSQLSGKSLHILARSWFKKRCNRKDQKNDDEDDAKKFLREFVEQAKASKALSRMSKKEKQVPSTSGPGHGRKSVLNMQKQGSSTSAPPRRTKLLSKLQNQVSSTSVPRRQRKSKPEMSEMPEIPEMAEMPKKGSLTDLSRAIELDGAGR